MSHPPPTNIPAKELWVKLQELPRPSQVVDLPQRTPDGEPVGQVALWVLKQEEHLICTAETEKFVRHHLKEAKRGDIGYDDMFANEMAVQILFRACRDVADLKKTAFQTPKQVRELFTTDECGLLFRNYLTIELEFGPLVTQMTDADMQAWIDKIAKGGSAFPFDSIHSDLQKILLLSMARRLQSSSTDTSFAGSLPETTSSADESSLEPSDTADESADLRSAVEASEDE